MYFCTPTSDPFDGLAKTLQAALALQARQTASNTSKSQPATVQAICGSVTSEAMAAAA